MKRMTFLAVAVTVWLAASARAGEIHDYLAGVLESTAPGEQVPVYVVFEERLGGDALQSLTDGLEGDARRDRVTTTLKEHANKTQRSVRDYVDARVGEGKAGRVRQIWMGNVLALDATPEVIRRIAAFSGVESIRFDAKQIDAVDDPGPWAAVTAGPPPQRGTPLQQGLILIRAEEVWNMGFTGEGVVVANIDTGVDYTHPDLVNQIWINGPEDINNDGRYTAADRNNIDEDNNGYVDDVVGYDFGNDDGDPMDSHGHGTSTGGQVCGDGTNGLRTGVAPDAKMICLKPWSSGSTETWIWEAMQYAVDNGADITTSSLSYKWAFDPKPNYPMWRTMTDVEHAAGVLHTNSVGNQGGNGAYPIPYNISTPGNCPPAWLHPHQTLRGGLSSAIGCGNVDAFDDTIENSSGRGPAAWEDIRQTHPEYPYEMPFRYQDYPYETIPGAMGLLKPDVSAPGASTTATTIGGGYGGFGGTSSATPHTAGACALMLSADLSMTSADVTRIIQLTSIEKGDPGKDIEYGAGRIDCVRAVQGVLGSMAPSVDSFSQTEIPMYAVTTITITGENFVAGTEVEFDGMAAASVIVIDTETLQVDTPVFPVWDNVDVTVRTGLGEVTAPDAVTFKGDLTLNTNNIRIGQNVNFTMRAAASAKWGYIIHTQLSNCVLKGLDFEVCPGGHLALEKHEQTNPVGSDFINWPVPNDPGLIGETLYIQAGTDGNGSLPGKLWRVTNLVSGVINP